MKKWFQVVAVILSICLILTACAPAEEDVGSNGNTADSQKVENLEKLCKVWGYTKYNHPAFLLGEKDWDEELLNLIPVVSKAKDDEVNDILHEWFASLGEIDYGTLNRVTIWAGAKEEDKSVQANIDWICKDYLGEELTEDLSQLGPVPNINRTKAPVKFDEYGVADFSNELSYVDMDYRDSNYRLMGLFRVWNIIEYYFPYLNLTDKNWESILPEYISKMLEELDKNNYYLTLLEMLTVLHDGHITLWDNVNVLYQYFGKYSVPVELTMVGKDWVVSKVWDNSCMLQQGDIIRKVEDIEIEERVEKVKQYVSVPNEEKMVKKISPWLLRSDKEMIKVDISREGEEMLLEIEGTENYYSSTKQSTVSHQLLDGNIGVINPSQVKDNEIDSIMKEFQSTEGLIIDLREYPIANDFSVLLSYIMRGQEVMYAYKASQAVPGSFVKERQWAGNITPSNPYYKQRGIYEYSGKVVVLIDQLTQSFPELYALVMEKSDQVTLLGSNTLGSVANISLIPLPGGNTISFSSVGVTTTKGEKVQRVGVVPDIEVHPTIEGIREGRDELMEAAVKYIKEQKNG